MIDKSYMDLKYRDIPIYFIFSKNGDKNYCSLMLDIPRYEDFYDSNAQTKPKFVMITENGANQLSKILSSIR